MSLDVYLEYEGESVAPMAVIPIREGGRMRHITRAEWDAKHPGIEPHTCEYPGDPNTVYSANITHNLNTMADEAGIYKHLWRPDEIGTERASDLIGPLKKGLALLKSDPERFMEFNPSNGWGNYEGLVEFVEEYLAACIQYRDANVRVWR